MGNALNPNGRLWWEPWELICRADICLYSIPFPKSNFGVAMHANIAEVQFTRLVDVWFKNMCNLLSEKNIPVMGEIFMSGANEEIEPLQNIFAPRLVFEELEAMYSVGKLTAIKEYYGTVPDKYDPNLFNGWLKTQYSLVGPPARLGSTCYTLWCLKINGARGMGSHCKRIAIISMGLQLAVSGTPGWDDRHPGISPMGYRPHFRRSCPFAELEIHKTQFIHDHRGRKSWIPGFLRT